MCCIVGSINKWVIDKLVYFILVSNEKIRFLLVVFRILWYMVVKELGLLLGLKNGINSIEMEVCFKMVDRSCFVWVGLFIINFCGISKK